MLKNVYHLMIRRIGAQQIITEPDRPDVRLEVGMDEGRTWPVKSPYKKPFEAQQVARKKTYINYGTDYNDPVDLDNFPLTAYAGEALY